MPKLRDMPTPPTDEITARQALEILDRCDPSTISRYVKAGKLIPSRQLPGKTGARLFWRHDVERLAKERSAA